jgi:hypothetical protein
MTSPRENTKQTKEELFFVCFVYFRLFGILSWACIKRDHQSPVAGSGVCGFAPPVCPERKKDVRSSTFSWNCSR